MKSGLENVINTIEERKVENKDSWKYYICLWFCSIKWVYVWGAGKALLKSCIYLAAPGLSCCEQDL